MKVNCVFFLIFLVLFCGFSFASATPPAKIVSGIVSNVASALLKWLWSLQSTSRTAISGRSLMRFESGYTVETVFDGSKLGLEPYSIEVTPNGEFLVLDSENSNIYKISTPFSPYSRPKLIVGSTEGQTGHVDGRPREARMNRPKGLTVDDGGNIYVADTLNMAIRKITEAGVVTIAGGNRGFGGSHVDGRSEDAKLSDDFDLVYVRSCCSLLVVDRGNHAIREIRLHEDDCSEQRDDNLNLGIAVLVVAIFFGYMLALLERRLGPATFSSRNDSGYSMRKGVPPPPYYRHPLIPYEHENSEEGLFGSLGRLFFNTGSSMIEIFGGIFSSFRKKLCIRNFLHQAKYQNPWEIQESFRDEPPSIGTRPPTAKKAYPVMTKQNRAFVGGWEHQQHHQRHYSSGPRTCYEPTCETNEIVFGAVQEQDERREAMVIKAVDYGDPAAYGDRITRSRYNYTGYSYGY